MVRFPYLANELYAMEEFVGLARSRIDAYVRHLTQGPSVKDHPGLRWRQVCNIYIYI